MQPGAFNEAPQCSVHTISAIRQDGVEGWLASCDLQRKMFTQDLLDYISSLGPRYSYRC